MVEDTCGAAPKQTTVREFREGAPAANARLREYRKGRRVEATLVNPNVDMPTVPLAAVALGVEPGQIIVVAAPPAMDQGHRA